MKHLIGIAADAEEMSAAPAFAQDFNAVFSGGGVMAPETNVAHCRPGRFYWAEPKHPIWRTSS